MPTTHFWWLLPPYAALCIAYIWRPIFSTRIPVKLTFKVLPMVLLCVWGGLAGSHQGTITGRLSIEACCFWGLCCSALGDAGLIHRSSAPVGILAFAAAQVLYIIMLSKLQQGSRGEWAAPVVAFALIDAALFAWLYIRLEGVERLMGKRILLLPVFLYFSLVSAMAGLAVALLFRPDPTAGAGAAGALLFWVSDHLIILGAYRALTQSAVADQYTRGPADAPKEGAATPVSGGGSPATEELKESHPDAPGPGGRTEPVPIGVPPGDTVRRLVQRGVMVTYYTAQVLLGLAAVWAGEG
eukprot:TRINITY_DN26507_c0_g1_i1.p1 TRINITY_DN26507_c0_g1~~TRINITY_DN26507_c0_g1_i1.p1  ORF type:complete len:316 (+),score=56.55 TRINITY_DN26507_c0_g1_i1:57-950(+)